MFALMSLAFAAGFDGKVYYVKSKWKIFKPKNTYLFVLVVVLRAGKSEAIVGNCQKHKYNGLQSL